MTRATRYAAQLAGIDPDNPRDLAELDMDECGYVTDTTTARLARQRAAYDRGACQCGWGRGHLAPELLNSGERAKQRLAYDRIHILTTLRHRALLADALLQGLAGQEAWDWADQRAADESGGWIYERAKHYGVPCERIKPYPVLAEPDHHDHWSARDARGWRTLVETVKCKESECADCCETPEADETQKAGEQA